MSVIDAVKRAISRRKLDALPLGEGRWQIPPDKTLESYLRAYGTIGWLFAVVSKISNGIADVQWHLYDQKDTDKRKEITKHPVLDLLDRPNPFQTGAEFMELANCYLELTGECFILKFFTTLNQPAQLWIRPPQMFDVVPDPEKYIAGYVYKVGQEKIPLEVNQVMHIKMPNPDNPYRGVGLVQALSVDLDTEDFASRWNRNFFYNEGRPDGVLRVPGTVSKDDYEKFREDYNRKHIGIANAHKTVVIRGDAIDYKQISMSQKDMDFLSLRKLTRDNILGISGMPASMMGITEVGSRARAEADEYIFGRWIIKPRCNRWRSLFVEDLLVHYGENLYLDYENPVPEDRITLVTEAVQTYKGGIVTRNEARTKLGYDPDKVDGDSYYVAPASPFGETESAAVKSVEDMLKKN